MMNMSIGCDVLHCRYNQQTEHYCTLEKIDITQVRDNKTACAGCASYRPQ